MFGPPQFLDLRLRLPALPAGLGGAVGAVEEAVKAAYVVGLRDGFLACVALLVLACVVGRCFKR